MMDQYGLLLQSFGFLIIIIALAYLAIRYGLRSVYRGLNGGRMNVLERLPLDPRSGSSLTLVQIGNTVYLVGTAQGGVTLLTTFNLKELDLSEDGAAEGQGDLKTSFSRMLNSFKNRGIKND